MCDFTLSTSSLCSCLTLCTARRVDRMLCSCAAQKNDLLFPLSLLEPGKEKEERWHVYMYICMRIINKAIYIKRDQLLAFFTYLRKNIFFPLQIFLHEMATVL